MRIKVCCIQSIDEARLAIRAGADAVGLVSKMPTGNGIADDRIRMIADSVPPTYSTVLLTVSDRSENIIEHQRRTRANTLQLVGPIEPEEAKRLRDELPGISLVKVIHVVDSSSIEAATRFSDVVDAILLDSMLELGDGVALGGTGQTHDWSISRQIREASPLPVFLAGGLSPANVTDAIRAVRPFGVDVCSALRPNGGLDPELLREFVSRASGDAT